MPCLFWAQMLVLSGADAVTPKYRTGNGSRIFGS
jgi:hypothetical protein